MKKVLLLGREKDLGDGEVFNLNCTILRLKKQLSDMVDICGKDTFYHLNLMYLKSKSKNIFNLYNI